MMVRPRPQSAACAGSTGSPASVATARSVMIHSPAGEFHVLLRQQGVHGVEYLVDLDSPAGWRIQRSTPRLSGRPVTRHTMPDTGRTALLQPVRTASCQRLSDRKLKSRSERRMEPGSSAASSSNPATSQVPLAFRRRPLRRRRSLPPAEAVQQPGRIAAEPAQQRLSRRALDGELADSAQAGGRPDPRSRGRRPASRCRRPRSAISRGSRTAVASAHAAPPAHTAAARTDPPGPTVARSPPGRRNSAAPATPVHRSSSTGWIGSRRRARPTRRRWRYRRPPHRYRPTAISATSTRWVPTSARCRRRCRTAAADGFGSTARVRRRWIPATRTLGRPRYWCRPAHRRSTTTQLRDPRTDGCVPGTSIPVHRRADAGSTAPLGKSLSPRMIGS